jgi:hypothetical protein
MKIFKDIPCAHCHQDFTPRGPRSEYCDKPKCQVARRQRKLAYMSAYQKQLWKECRQEQHESL